MRTSRTFPVLAVLLLSVALACGGSGDTAAGDRPSSSVIRCPEPGDSVLYNAVRAYVRQLEPRPVRFVMVPGGAEALPSAARSAMQQIGPTFMWPADTALQTKTRAMLKERGQFTTMLLAFKGMERTGRDEVVVRFGGTYIGGDLDGRQAPLGAVTFGCDRARWVLDTARVGKAA